MEAKIARWKQLRQEQYQRCIEQGAEAERVIEGLGRMYNESHIQEDRAELMNKIRAWGVDLQEICEERAGWESALLVPWWVYHGELGDAMWEQEEAFAAESKLAWEGYLAGGA
jgi:hypothetical protein